MTRRKEIATRALSVYEREYASKMGQDNWKKKGRGATSYLSSYILGNGRMVESPRCVEKRGSHRIDE